MQKILFIRAEWEEAGVWVAMSDDVPRLTTEAETMEAGSDLGKHAHLWTLPVLKGEKSNA
ncbi:MAG TPA: DUF1902 domain-containing protein [Thiobacillaceae bacterium]|nr:DUF1902 domain-containing protein [Thiobacillaceae bacterium]